MPSQASSRNSSPGCNVSLRISGSAVTICRAGRGEGEQRQDMS